MNKNLEAALNYATTQLHVVRQQLIKCDVEELSATQEIKDRAGITKAFCYIWSAACLEDFMRRITRALLDEIELAKVGHSDLRLSLFGLSFAAELEFIRNAGKKRTLERWRRFSGAFQRTASSDFAAFTVASPPFDGRTLRAEHFETFWHVFGFKPPALPNPIMPLALEDLATARNDVAHGHVDPLAFGRSKATQDVRRMVGAVEDLLTHVTIAADGYIQRREYRR